MGLEDEDSTATTVADTRKQWGISKGRVRGQIPILRNSNERGISPKMLKDMDGYFRHAFEQLEACNDT